MLKRILACGLSAAMAFSLLTGCGSSDSGTVSSSNPTIPTAAEKDVDHYLTDGAISSDDVVMTIDDEKISASAYFYLVSYYANSLKSYYTSDSSSDTFQLSQKYDDNTTYSDYVRQETEDTLVSFVAIAKQAKKWKVTLTKDEQSSLDNLSKNTNSDTMLYYATNLKGLKYVFTNSNYGTELQNKLFNKGGKYYANKKTLNDYYKDNVFGAKHILIMTTNLSKAEKAKAKKTIQGYLNKILKSDDPVSTFDMYMNKYSEDTGLKDYPDGYTFMSGDMVQEFEDAVVSLKVGKIDPKIVETSYGYHIIMRTEPDRDQIKDDTLKENYQKDTFNSLIEDWSKDLKVTPTDALEQLDLNAFYEKLSQLQSTIDAINEANDNSDTSTVS